MGLGKPVVGFMWGSLDSFFLTPFAIVDRRHAAGIPGLNTGQSRKVRKVTSQGGAVCGGLALSIRIWTLSRAVL